MSVPPDKIPPLPRVVSPLGWSWYYFRIRYLPMLASGLIAVMVVWLWSANLPDSTGMGAGSRTSGPVDPVSNTERQAVVLVSTNVPDLQTSLTNGQIGLGGGL